MYTMYMQIRSKDRLILAGKMVHPHGYLQNSLSHDTVNTDPCDMYHIHPLVLSELQGQLGLSLNTNNITARELIAFEA